MNDSSCFLMFHLHCETDTYIYIIIMLDAAILHSIMHGMRVQFVPATMDKKNKMKWARSVSLLLHDIHIRMMYYHIIYIYGT